MRRSARRSITALLLGLGLCGLSLGSVTSPAGCTPQSPPQPEVAQAGSDDLSKALNLTGAQKEKLAAVHDRYRDQKQALRTAVAEQRKQLMAQMQMESPDRAAMERSMQQIVSLEGQRQKLMVDEYFEVIQILRPEQRKLFRDQVVKRMVR